jgi:Ca-activated chloride channel homolog
LHLARSPARLRCLVKTRQPPDIGGGQKGWSGMRTIAGFMFAAVLAASTAVAQSPETRFQSGVDLVALNVVVTDPQGRFVSGLSSPEFLVFEDGQPQDISVFEVVPAPIDLALLLDTSSSMADKIGTVQQAAIGFTSVVRQGDRISIVDVKDTVKVIHPLNEDFASARQAIKSTYARGNTALYNGIYTTLTGLVRQRAEDSGIRRQALVVLSDGADTSSLVALDDLMDLAKNAGVAIYTITLQTTLHQRSLVTSGGPAQAEALYAMKALSSETGARAFFPAAIQELAGVYDMIAQELANQYLVGYVPKNVRRDGSYRRVDVRIDRAEVRARTRSGYKAPTQSSASTR